MTKKPLQVAIQMDDIAVINLAGDSSFVLGLEAQKRGYELYHYLPQDLTYRQGSVVARAHKMELRREEGNHYSFGPEITLDMADDVDVVLMRQDPPFDMAYITATHLLELVHPDTLVVNDPVEVRNAPEKLFVMKYLDLMPPTMITHRLDEVQAFRAEHGEIIVKPLYGMGGDGVFHLRQDDSNLAALHEMFMANSREPIMIQKFLPEVVGGDKRIILVDGEIAGAINRVPAAGEIRSNLVAGGVAEDTVLTDRERFICERLRDDLKARGLIFVGIDVIGDWLTEINVTSPTGLQSINAFQNVELEATIWDAIERKLS